MKKGWHVVKPVVEQRKKQSFSELLYGSPNWTRITDIMHTTIGGIGRCEEMFQLLELHHAKVLIIPRVALSQSVRVANNDC